MATDDQSGRFGPVALVGSGEFLPQMRAVDAALLEGRPKRAVIMPTASAPEGAAVFERWIRLGEGHYRGLGVEPVPLRVTDREAADDKDVAARIEGAGLIYLSGGNPGYLAETLRGTLVLDAIVEAWRAGAALAGCSAGAIALGTRAPDVSGGAGRGAAGPTRPDRSGLGVIPNVAVIPHFDRFATWRPGMVSEALAELRPGEHLLGIDEDTALVGGPTTWHVEGRQAVWVITAEGRTRHPGGATIETP